MTVDQTYLQSTLREWRRWQRPLILWGMITLVAGVAGPFGTLDALGFGRRLLYWAAVTGGSVGLSVGTFMIARERPSWQTVMVWGIFCFSVATLVHALNSVVFFDWGGVDLWAYLLGIVALVTASVHGLMRLVGGPTETPEGAAEPDLRFQRRLPTALRGGALQRIEAQDHYLNVVTDKGSTLILMRMADAVEELATEPGQQVHRSHWVAASAVKSHRRANGRDLLVMSDGAEVPVSRSFRAAAQEGGFF